MFEVPPPDARARLAMLLAMQDRCTNGSGEEEVEPPNEKGRRDSSPPLSAPCEGALNGMPFTSSDKGQPLCGPLNQICSDCLSETSG